MPRFGNVRPGFTIVELLIVIGIIAILIGLLFPAIGRTRESARLSQSLTNLRNLSTAHIAYATTYNDRQFTLINDNIASFGDTPYSAINTFVTEMGQHPPITLGYATGPNGAYANWRYFINAQLPFNMSLVQPLNFTGQNQGFGSFRLCNVRQFNSFVNGRFYDRVFYAPKDRVVIDAIENPVDAGLNSRNCFEDPGQYCIRPAVGVNDIPIWMSYVLSPAAMFSPQVMADEWRNPWSLNGGFRSPSMGQALHPSLKTHMIEHHWLQNRRADCNPGFSMATPYGLNCEPYYFNHGLESAPAALFYDGSVRTVSTREAERADARIRAQSGSTNGLWHRSTGGYGANGYFIDRGYDQAETSYHILTTEGIRGRDFTTDSGR
jgi:prepilin-type N-terminal cleavage/methylation domain-containing protein